VCVCVCVCVLGGGRGIVEHRVSAPSPLPLCCALSCRSVLDFDFEKLCSISLSHINAYACLVCGKYFQGKETARRINMFTL
jgi:hypothetical protein